MKSNDAEDKNKRQNEDNDGVDLEARGLVSVEPYNPMSVIHTLIQGRGPSIGRVSYSAWCLLSHQLQQHACC